MRDILEAFAEIEKELQTQEYCIGAPQAKMIRDEVVDPVQTYGLIRYGMPELITFGLRPDLGSSILGQLAELQMKQGAFTHGRAITDELFIENCGTSLLLIEVTEPHLSSYLGISKALFPDKELKGMQVVWHDENLKWPWNPGSEANQKLIGVPPREFLTEAQAIALGLGADSPGA